MTRHPTTATPLLHRPQTVLEAVDLLADGSATVLAGGTWVMRGGIRGEGFAEAYVLVSRLPSLLQLEYSGGALIVGAAVTHACLADFLAGDARFAGLAAAAQKSANPSIRRAATVGGNLSTIEFPAADLVPAFLAVAAEVTIVDTSGQRRLALAEYLAARASTERGSLMTHLTVPIPEGYSAQARLTLRRAGDYPVGIVSAHVRLDSDGVVNDATVAVGSVEPVARIWPSLASQLVGSALDSAAAERSARDLIDEFSARDGVEAAAWYRLKVLPTLVGRAFQTLQRQAGKQ